MASACGREATRTRQGSKLRREYFQTDATINGRPPPEGVQMRISSGLLLVAAAVTISACTASSPHASPQPAATASLLPATIHTASASAASAICQPQVAAWIRGAELTVNEIFSEVLKLTGAMTTASRPSQLAPYAGPFRSIAQKEAEELPPKCSTTLSRDWVSLDASLFGLSAHLRLGDTAGIDSYASRTVGAIARMTIDLHMQLKP
jgi:hypothetical protein